MDTRCNFMNLIELKNYTTYNESEIIDLIKKNNPNISEIKIKWVLFELEKKQIITRIGTKQYITNGKLYSFELSDLSKSINSFLNENYPMVNYVIWESTQLNEWMNLLLTKNIIFIEVESEFKDYFFSVLQEHYSTTNIILLNPSFDILSRYIDNKPIIIKPLFSRSPLNKKTHQITIEKLLVDVFSDKLLTNLISTNNQNEIAYGITHSYSLNKSKTKGL